MSFVHKKPLYPIREAFRILGVSPVTGYNKLLHKGLLDTVCIGRNRYATADSIDKCIALLEASQNSPDDSHLDRDFRREEVAHGE